jgi:hypothetical protein
LGPIDARRSGVRAAIGGCQDIAGGVQDSETSQDDIRKNKNNNKDDAGQVQQPLGGDATKDVEVHDSDNAKTTVDEQPERIPTSGEHDPSAGNVCYKQIKYDMSDFLVSCVRLCKDLAHSHDEPLKPAHTEEPLTKLEMTMDYVLD